MTKQKQFIPGRFVGSDLGNPGLDELGSRVDKEGIYTKELINTAISADESLEKSKSRRIEIKDRSNRATKVAVAITALVIGAAGVGKLAPDEQPPVTKQQMEQMSPEQHLIRMHEDAGEVINNNP